MPNLHKSVKKVAQKGGLILGAGLIAITVIAYAINWDVFLSPWLQIGKFALTLSIAVWAVIKSRQLCEGEFSFRDGFSSFFISIAIGLLLTSIANWLLFNLIDAQAGHYINDTSIALRQHQLEEMGKDPEFIKMAITQLKSSYQFTLINQLKGYITNIVLYCIPAIIVALIVKTKKPIVR